MAKPTDSKEDGLERPVRIPDSMRLLLKEKREEMKMSQRALAGRIGTTSATISNVERGSQGTLEARIYMRWRRFLLKEHAQLSDDVWERLVDAMAGLDDDEAERLIAMAPLLKGVKKR